jgi:hypothetical protein
MKMKVCVGALALAVVGTAQADVLYGISNGFGTAANNRIYQINPANGDLSNITQVTLSGFTINSSQALAADPLTNTLYAVVQTGTGPSNRRLITVNPTTGVGTDIGSLSNSFSSLAFKADGTLIGVTGDGDATAPETLFQINKANASTSVLFALGNGLDGETIAMHTNGLLYHSSGNSVALFESVNLTTQAVTPIGSATGEAFAMGYSVANGQMYLSDISSNLYTVDIATGVRTLVGGMSDQLGTASDNRGLAFVAVPEPASMAALGFGALALIRRRRSRKA